MKIFHKLFLLVSITMIALFVAVGAFLRILAPIVIVQNEYSTLVELKDSMYAMLITVLNLEKESIQDAQETYRQHFEKSRRDFEAVASLKRLPDMNQTIAEAFTTAARLQELFNEQGTELTEVIKNIYSLQEETDILSFKVELADLVDSYPVQRRGLENRFTGVMTEFNAGVNSVAAGLRTTITIIGEQDAVIDTEIRGDFHSGVCGGRSYCPCCHYHLIHNFICNVAENQSEHSYDQRGCQQSGKRRSHRKLHRSRQRRTGFSGAEPEPLYLQPLRFSPPHRAGG